MGAISSGGGNSSAGKERGTEDISVKCPYCGRKLTEGAAACKYCMTPVDPATGAAISQTPEQLDAQFKQLKGKVTLFKALLAAAVVGLVITLIIAQLVPIIALVVLTVAALLMYMGRNSILSDYIAGSVVLTALQETFQNVHYDPEACFDRETIRDAQLIGGWNDIGGNDYVNCEYKGVHLAMSDVTLTHEVRVNDKKKVTQIFKGRWMLFDYGKELSTNLIVREKTGGMLNKLTGSEQSSVQTESEEFNSKFQIVTTDPVSAFYVLTPNMMEYIMATEKRTGGRFYISFSGSHVHVAIDGLIESFDRSTSAAKSLESLRNRAKADIKLVVDIMEQLGLLNNLFTKPSDIAR